jgi:hypothetical protein
VKADQILSLRGILSRKSDDRVIDDGDQLELMRGGPSTEMTTRRVDVLILLTTARSSHWSLRDTQAENEEGFAVLGSDVLEVAIGLAFFFFLVAILVSTINELIARALRLRHSTLRSGIGMLLADPNLTTIGRELYSHPLILALEKKGRPSYIHGRTFAAALLDTIAPGKTTVAAINAAVEGSNLPGDLKRQLTIIIHDAGTDYAALRSGVQLWFDDSMERVSGWYKRKVQVVTFVVATAITLGLNADSLALANGMLQDPTTRDAFIAQLSSATAARNATQVVPVIDVAAIKTALDPLGFDLGWAEVDQTDPVAWFTSPTNWLGRAPGWLVTVLAVLMGAPFWFDAVGRLTNLRASGNPPNSRAIGES